MVVSNQAIKHDLQASRCYWIDIIILYFATDTEKEEHSNDSLGTAVYVWKKRVFVCWMEI